MQTVSEGITPYNQATNTFDKHIQTLQDYRIECNPDKQVFIVSAANLFDALTKFYLKTGRNYSTHPDFETLKISVYTEKKDSHASETKDV